MTVKIPKILELRNFIKNQNLCQLFPAILKGPLEVNLSQQPLSWSQIEAENNNNSKGGHHHPSHYTNQHKVAILIPYR